MNIEEQVAKLQESYKVAASADKGKLYQELLDKYHVAQQKIEDLEKQLKSRNNLPSKDEVETMSSMLDLIGKLDETTIEKLSKFGGNKE